MNMSIAFSNQSITNRDSKSINLYFNEVRPYDVLTPEAEEELVIKAHQGSKHAKDLLIYSNLRAVITIAKQYAKYPMQKGIELDDLIEEGNMGLMDAVDSFDPTMGFRFLTYAKYKVQQSIQQFLYKNGDMYRIPINQKNDINAMYKAMSNFELKNERRPSVYEVAEMMGWKSSKVAKYLRWCGQSDSLDAPIQGVEGEDTYCLSDVLSNIEDTEHSEKTIISKEIHDKLESMINTLPNKQRLVISMLYGFNGYEAVESALVANAMGSNTERVRQLKVEALKRLRSMCDGDLQYELCA